MSVRLLHAALLSAVAAASLSAAERSAPRTSPKPGQPDRSYRTAIQWERDVAAAAKKAERLDKLLMVLAVAGHFEDPFFT